MDSLHYYGNQQANIGNSLSSALSHYSALRCGYAHRPKVRVIRFTAHTLVVYITSSYEKKQNVQT